MRAASQRRTREAERSRVQKLRVQSHHRQVKSKGRELTDTERKRLGEIDGKAMQHELSRKAEEIASRIGAGSGSFFGGDSSLLEGDG